MYTGKGIRMVKKRNLKKIAITCLAVTIVFIMTACGNKEGKNKNLVNSAGKDKKVVTYLALPERSWGLMWNTGLIQQKITRRKHMMM